MSVTKEYLIGAIAGALITGFLMHAKVKELQVGISGLTAVIVMQNTP